MRDVKPSDGLLPASLSLALLEFLASRPVPVDVDRLVHDLSALAPISWARANNSINKLCSYGIVRRESNAVAVERRFVFDDMRAEIAQNVAQELAGKLTSSHAWSCVRQDAESGAVVIDTLLLPPLVDGLGMWVADFGVARRDTVAARYWTVDPSYIGLFLTEVRRANREHLRRSKSASRLAFELEQQALYGSLAEEWVVAFERRRLNEHPLQDQIRRISSDDVTAGYDILSFSSMKSLRHDLFIEVKSYATKKVFHWSRNEIATAREFGDAYALYLVDRDLYCESEYAPQIIKGPSTEMFLRPDSGWRVEATSFEHVAIKSPRFPR